MITKLWSALMLKLTRLIVRLDTARDAIHQADSLWQEIEDSNKPPEPITKDLDFWEEYSND